jgi:prepilin-type N-terminal cleavage/methylation domain-containing protein
MRFLNGRKRQGERLSGVSGVSLIEILISIALLAILTSFVMVSIRTARAKAKDRARMTDMYTIETALNLYKEKHGTFPCAPDATNSVDLAFLQVLVDEGFLPDNPRDPVNAIGPGGVNYAYYYRSYRAVPDGPPCQVAHVSYDIEFEETPCIFDGKFVSSTHCHAFIPHAMQCEDPYHEVTPYLCGNCVRLGEQGYLGFWYDTCSPLGPECELVDSSPLPECTG